MAFSLVPAASLVYNMKDETGSQAKVIFHVPADTLASVALAGADTLAGLLANLTDCQILSYSLTYASEDPSPSTAGAGSRVEHKGRFLWELANGQQTKQEIPGIKPGVVAQDGAIDLTDTDVGLFKTAILAVDALFCGVDGADITALAGAYEAFKRSTRSQLPSRRLAT